MAKEQKFEYESNKKNDAQRGSGDYPRPTFEKKPVPPNYKGGPTIWPTGVHPKTCVISGEEKLESLTIEPTPGMKKYRP